MTKMRNYITGTVMYVADDRVPEYVNMGHEVIKPPVDIAKRAEIPVDLNKVEKPKKKTVKAKKV